VELAIRIAEQFGQHIADADYSAAHSLLTKEAKQKYTPEGFKQSFEEMTAYEPGSIHRLEVRPEFMLGEWPEKGADDVGSVYVGLFGEEYVEAVTLVLAREDGDIRIREVEWGRP
jgi:hypothetical protein